MTFKDVDERLVTYSSTRPTGFELCGKEEDCRFVDAELSGNRVLLQAGDMPAVRVRFCWADAPVCNLYDKSGLPAGTVRNSRAIPPDTSSTRMLALSCVQTINDEPTYATDHTPPIRAAPRRRR